MRKKESGGWKEGAPTEQLVEFALALVRHCGGALHGFDLRLQLLFLAHGRVQLLLGNLLLVQRLQVFLLRGKQHRGNRICSTDLSVLDTRIYIGLDL